MSILKKSYIFNRTKSKVAILLISSVALFAAIIVSVCVGAVKISLKELFDIVFGGNSDSASGRIFHHVRLPRTLAACLAGMALSVAGTILQTVLSNPMCSPSIIGVNAGAGFFMIVIVALFPSAIGFAPLSAFVGALVAVFTVYLLAKKTGASKLSVVLSGIAVSSLLAALTDMVLTLVPDASLARIDFLIGSFSGVTMSNVIFAAVIIIVALIVTFMLSADVNILMLGDSTAKSLGLRVGAIRGLFLVISAMLAGSAISLGGLIGFVGLVVPHVAKAIIGHDHRFLFPLSAIIGGAFCLVCDILSRVLFIPYELPVGILMSLIGCPFFIWLALRGKRRQSYD